MSIAAHSRWNLLGFVSTLAAHLITVPIAIDRIGLAEFGRAGLVMALLSPLFIGAVLGSAVIRLVSSADPASLNARLCGALNNALLVVLAVGMGVVAIAAGLLPLLLVKISPGDVSLETWRINLSIAAAAWIAQQYALVIQGAFAGEQRFATIAFISVHGSIATVVGVLGFVRLLPTSTGYLLGVAFGLAATATGWIIVAVHRHGLRVLRPALHSETLAPVMHFGKWQAVTSFSSNFANQIDRYVLGVIASPVVIGQFNAANRLQEAAYAMVTKAAEVLFPHFGAHSSASLEHQLAFFVRATWVTVTFAAVALAPGIVLATPLLTLWAGADVATGGGLLLQILLLGGLIGCSTNVTTYYLMGIGDIATVAKLSLWYSGITVLASLALLLSFGPYAAGGGIVIASLLRVGMSVHYVRQIFGRSLNPWRIWWSTVAPLAIGLAIAGTLVWITPVLPCSWLTIAVAYVSISAFIALASTMGLIIYPEGRAWLRDIRAGLRPQSSSRGRHE